MELVKETTEQWKKVIHRYLLVSNASGILTKRIYLAVATVIFKELVKELYPTPSTEQRKEVWSLSTGTYTVKMKVCTAH